MVEAHLSEKFFNRYLEYYITYQKSGNIKYFWEISVPDDEFDEFLSFLNNVNLLGFTFGFQIINRYKNYKLLYGFSDFDISSQSKNMKLFDFFTKNNEALCGYICQWHAESKGYLISDSVLFYLKN